MNALEPQTKIQAYKCDLDRIQSIRRWLRKPNQAALIHHLLNKAEEERKSGEAIKNEGGGTR